VLRWAREQGCVWDHLSCWWAARHGHGSVLRWAMAHGCPTSGSRAGGDDCPRDRRGYYVLTPHGEYGPWATNVCEAAALGGHFELLQQLVREHPVAADLRCVGDYICEAAASVGRLSMLQWLRTQGCELNSGVWRGACRRGSVDILEWLQRMAPHTRPARSSTSPARDGELLLFRAAAKGGHLAALAWLQPQPPPPPPPQPGLGGGTEIDVGGDAASVRVGSERQVRVWQAIVASAAAGGHLNVLSWAERRRPPTTAVERPSTGGGGGDDGGGGGAPPAAAAAAAAAAYPSAACDGAALGGHLAALRWLRERGCEWGQRTCLHAASGGHLPVLRYLAEAGCPQLLPLGGVYNRSSGGGGSSQALFCGDRVMAAAAAEGELPAVRWLHRHGCPMSVRVLEAARSGSAVLWGEGGTRDGVHARRCAAVARWLEMSGCPTTALPSTTQTTYLDLLRRQPVGDQERSTSRRRRQPGAGGGAGAGGGRRRGADRGSRRKGRKRR
jgi:hypothetical protein